MNLFYKGCRAHHRLNSIVNKKFVVNVEKENRFFLNFESIDEFEAWYVLLPPKDRTINEVVLCDRRKLIIDIDENEASCCLDMFDFERHVVSRIRDVFAMLGVGTPKVIMYRMANELNETSQDKLSYHAIVSNFTFTARTCMGLCMIISSNQVWDGCVDTGIYKSVQCVRMEGSTKFGEYRWKKKCSDAFFRQGILSCTEGTEEADIVCNPVRSPSTLTTTLTDLCGIVDMSQFKPGKLNTTYGTLPLYRIKPGYCPECNRVHDKENAAIMHVAGKPIFICWRSSRR